MFPINNDFTAADPGFMTEREDGAAIDKLVEIADHLAASKDIADTLKNPFLTYLLDMTIQAVRMEMRPKALRAYRKPR